MISTVVTPNSYGETWVLREHATGRILDVGSSWAKAMGVLTDTRPLVSVGIRGGWMYQVVSLII